MISELHEKNMFFFIYFLFILNIYIYIYICVSMNHLIFNDPIYKMSQNLHYKYFPPSNISSNLFLVYFN